MSPTQSKQYLAHVRQKDDGSFEIHDLEEHLREVAKGAAKFAETFGSSDWGFLAGLWHDLGKYSAEFQRCIKAVSGYDPDAHLEGQPGRVDHSTAGAQHAIAQLGLLGRILAYLIAGRHTRPIRAYPTLAVTQVKMLRARAIDIKYAWLRV